MSASFDITRVSDHEYRVRTEAEGQSVESLFRMNPDLQGRLGTQDAEEVAVVEATALFLSRHQSVVDFPPMIDLEDILATYDDAPEQIQRLLAEGSPAPEA